jgi:hypothetical protein
MISHGELGADCAVAAMAVGGGKLLETWSRRRFRK